MLAATWEGVSDMEGEKERGREGGREEENSHWGESGEGGRRRRRGKWGVSTRRRELRASGQVGLGVK